MIQPSLSQFSKYFEHTNARDLKFTRHMPFVKEKIPNEPRSTRMKWFARSYPHGYKQATTLIRYLRLNLGHRLRVAEAEAQTTQARRRT